MHSLYLYRNQLSGNIPTTLGDLSDIEVLDLSNNQLTGGVPAVLGYLPELYDLALEYNQLTGSISTVFRQLINQIFSCFMKQVFVSRQRLNSLA